MVWQIIITSGQHHRSPHRCKPRLCSTSPQPGRRLCGETNRLQDGNGDERLGVHEDGSVKCLVCLLIYYFVDLKHYYVKLWLVYYCPLLASLIGGKSALSPLYCLCCVPSSRPHVGLQPLSLKWLMAGHHSTTMGWITEPWGWAEVQLLFRYW